MTVPRKAKVIKIMLTNREIHDATAAHLNSQPSHEPRYARRWTRLRVGTLAPRWAAKITEEPLR